MDELVSLSATLGSLEGAFGLSGAINQIWQALRSGELIGSCERFHGHNASQRPILQLPNRAENLTLPREFWGHAQWQTDGESVVVAKSQPFDPWVFKADWRNGNFCVSGSRGRGHVQIMRRAEGVRLAKDEAEAFLVTRGLMPNWTAESASRKKENMKIEHKLKQKPGPKADPDWALAIAKVTKECIAAGYRNPPERGNKASIQTQLLNFMAEKGKDFSQDTAAKYAQKVIDALPGV